MFRNIHALILFAVLVSAGCGSGVPNSNTDANSSAFTNREIKLDPANLPPGLSASPLPSTANLPPGISLNPANVPLGNKPIPGIPTNEQLRKGFKPGKSPIPGIPDEATIRKQMSQPVANVNAPPK